MTRRIARDLALALLESLARERLHHLVGFGEPSLARPVHAAPATQLHQAIRSLHVPLLLVVGSASSSARRRKSARTRARQAPSMTCDVVSHKRASHGTRSVGPMLTAGEGAEEVSRTMRAAGTRVSRGARGIRDRSR